MQVNAVFTLSKDGKEELFDREKELREFEDAIKRGGRLVLLLGSYINDLNFSSLLENLVKSGYVEKKEGRYAIPDPVLAKVFKEL